MANPEGATIKFKLGSRAAHSLRVTNNFYEAVDRSAYEEHGLTIQELALEDPTTVYRLLRSAVARTAIEAASDISVDGLILGDASLEDKEAMRFKAEDYLRNFLPSYDDGPFTVSVGLLPSAEDVAAGFIGPDDSCEVLDLLVLPPSLAA